MFRRNRNKNTIEYGDQYVPETVESVVSDDPIIELRLENPDLFDTLVKERINDIHHTLNKRRHAIRFLRVTDVNDFLQNWFELSNIARQYYNALESGGTNEYLELVNQIDTIVAEMHYLILIRKTFNDDFNLMQNYNMEYKQDENDDEYNESQAYMLLGSAATSSIV